jgi:hypothetical protein
MRFSMVVVAYWPGSLISSDAFKDFMRLASGHERRIGYNIPERRSHVSAVYEVEAGDLPGAQHEALKRFETDRRALLGDLPTPGEIDAEQFHPKPPPGPCRHDCSTASQSSRPRSSRVSHP